MKKAVCIILTTLLLLSLPACSQNNTPGGKQQKVDISQYVAEVRNGSAEKLTLTWMIPTQQSKAINTIPSILAAAAKFNINLVVKEEPVSTHNEKLTLGLSDNSLTDIISWVSTSNANANGPVGAYVDLSLYEDEMENFTAIRDNCIAENPNNYNVLYNSEGSYYVTPHYLTDPINLFDFSINLQEFKRIKEKYNLTWTNPDEPSTWAEIEEVLIKYKEEYEANIDYECYPLTFRNFQSTAKELQLFVESYTAAEASTLDFFGFDESEDEFVFAPAMEGYKKGVAQYADWFKKGLISPDKTVDENNLKNQIKFGDVIMIADYIGGWSGMNYLQRDTGYVIYPLQIPKAEGMKRILGREVTNFDSLVGTALNSKLLDNPEKLARAVLFLDYLYSDAFTEDLWFNDDVTTKNVPAEYENSPLSVRKAYFTYNNNTVYNTSTNFDYTSMNNKYFPWNICNGFVDLQDERPNPNIEATANYINYRDNVLRAPYKEGYDRETSDYVYGKCPTVLLTASEQKKVLQYETTVTDKYRIYISEFAEGKKNMTTDWDAFVQELLNAGGAQMIEIYNNAYRRAR
ncbi:MAG: hypothetical protein ACI4S9_08760 [Christensenellales bacterium]